jgi:putative ABC transport system permease protein
MLQDLRYAARTLIANRAFTLVAIVTLALGIGANTAIFSVVNAVLLEPLPYPNAERLVAIWETRPNIPFDRIPTSGPDFEDWRAQTTSFEMLAAFEGRSLTLTGRGEPETLPANAVSANAFDLVGIPALLGRTFRPDDEVATQGRTVILSHSLWKERFNSDPNVVGGGITLDDLPYTVIGVMPSEFDFPPSIALGGRDLMFHTKVWTVMDLAAKRNTRGNKSIIAFGRLREGASIVTAQAEMEALGKRLAEEYPNANRGMGILVKPLLESVVRNAQPSLLVLLGAVGLLLVVACANVANLMLARATTRRRELAIRMAMGASAPRVVRLLLTESMLLSIAGSLAGFFLAVWSIDFLVVIASDQVPRLRTLQLDATVFLFTLGVTVAAGLLFGLAPSLQARRTDLNQTLKDAGGGKSSARHGLGNVFIVAEVAMAAVLLVAAGLLIQTFLHLQRVDLGFNPTNLMALQLTLPPSKYPVERRAAFYEEALERLRSSGTITSAAVSTAIPLGDSLSSGGFTIENREPDLPGTMNPGTRFNVSEGYLRTMEIPVVRGRDFSTTDRGTSAPVAIINEELARRYWAGDDPIGKRVKFSRPTVESQWFTIVGISRNVRSLTLQQKTTPEIYIPYAYAPPADAYIVVRSSSESEFTASLLRRTIAEIDPNQPVEVTGMDALLARSVAKPRLQMLLLTGFGVMALALAAVGIYGVMSYFVNERTREIGVRMALGAQKQTVLRIVLARGVMLTLSGLGIGLLSAAALSRFLSSLLFEITGTDIATYVAVAFVLLALSLAAIYIPARRATRVDPMIALRHG